ncbi:O-methyltransferase [Fusibacter tunisiensis]|uniref:tRNA 5-hydroxyuridine methyltransferase n=1 Tax=Fusibacter tunisiensis TaxID=1008308 RepID=A0ABS2MQA5_9FIRM|nr:O-methyltransferase [Fusibacter tunisiensis]MBM7561576.1 putative O-methyltransferase YrrM [Fusibacter tunisiensis]
MTQKSNIVDTYVEKYIRSLLPKSDGLLAELETYAEMHHIPIVHPEVAQHLKVLIQIQKPNRILEIGTAIGYSAALMALGMTGGRIETIELKEEMIEKAKETFEKLESPVDIIQHQGDAQMVLKEIEGTFDLIFIDASKGHYQTFFDLALPKLRPGGIIVSDNVLYKGMVATDAYLVKRKITIVKRMRRFLAYISDKPNIETTILPLGDGLAITYKKEAVNRA